MYRLKTPSHQIALVLSALAEGLDPSAAERVFGFRQATITTWLTRAGKHAQILIERAPLTIRHGIAALARRSWATAQQSPCLLAHLEWWRAYYHFVRPHVALRVALVQPQAQGGNRLAQRYRQRTPAMAAGRTTRRWTAREVLSCPEPSVSA